MVVFCPGEVAEWLVVKGFGFAIIAADQIIGENAQAGSRQPIPSLLIVKSDTFCLHYLQKASSKTEFLLLLKNHCFRRYALCLDKTLFKNETCLIFYDVILICIIMHLAAHCLPWTPFKSGQDMSYKYSAP